MNRILTAVCFVSLAAGCSGSNSVYLAETLFLGTGCDLGTDVAQINGSIDVGQTSSYLIAFAMGSSSVGDEVEIDGRPVSTEASNDFLGEEIVLNYAVGGANVVAEQRIPISLLIPAGASPDNTRVQMNLLTTAAVAALRTQTTFPTTVIVSIYVRGALRGGTPVTTNTLRFPLTLTGNTTCPAGTAPLFPDPSTTCGNPSQDIGGPSTCL